MLDIKIENVLNDESPVDYNKELKLINNIIDEFNLKIGEKYSEGDDTYYIFPIKDEESITIEIGYYCIAVKATCKSIDIPMSVYNFIEKEIQIN